MPVEVTWGNPEHTYTIFKFTGKWTWDEYYQSINDGQELIADTPGMVNILIDVTEANLVPENLLSHTSRSMNRPPREFALAVVVTDSNFVKILVGILDKLFGKKTHFPVVRTLPEAHELLREYDQEHGRTGVSSTSQVN